MYSMPFNELFLIVFLLACQSADLESKLAYDLKSNLQQNMPSLVSSTSLLTSHNNLASQSTNDLINSYNFHNGLSSSDNLINSLYNSGLKILSTVHSPNHRVNSQFKSRSNEIINNSTNFFLLPKLSAKSTKLSVKSGSSTFKNGQLNDRIRAINSKSNNFENEKSTQGNELSRNEMHKFKNNKIKKHLNRKYSRRRRRSSAHYSSDLSLNKKTDQQKEELISLSHKFKPDPLTNLAKKYTLIDPKFNKSILDVYPQLHLIYDSYNDYNSTNATTYVELPPSLKVFFYCVYTLIFFVGLIGNSLNIYVVYSNKNMYNVTYFFITNLAMSDILLCLFSVPITPMYLLLYKHWPFGKLLCHLLPFSQGVSVYVSAFTLMSIAVDRYFVIIFPFKKRMSIKMCVCIIVIIWISGSTLTLPYAIFMQLVEADFDDGEKLKFCEEAWPHVASRRTFSTCTSVIQFIVPFVIIAFCYSKVCSKLKTRAKFKPGAKSAKKEELERERSRRTNRMLIAMVVIFGLAWLPLNVHNLVVDFYDSANNWAYIRCFFLLAHAIAMSCTCYNFCLYAYLNDHFRKNFKDVLPCFDLPFFKRNRNEEVNNQNDQPANRGITGLKAIPNEQFNNATSSMPLTKDLLTKIEPSTKQIMLTENDQKELLNSDEQSIQQASICSKPANTNLDDESAIKCPCSTSYPNFQLSLNNSKNEQKQTQFIQERDSSGSKHLIKSLRNRLRFSGESSFDNQAIVLNEFSSNEYSLNEPNNNTIKSNNQSNQSITISSSSNNSINTPQNNNLPNSQKSDGKSSTIFLSGLHDMIDMMDNV